MAKTRFTVIWEFRVRNGQNKQFENAYGKEGRWVKLFSEIPEYRGTQLLRDMANANRYITIDRWDSYDAYESFRKLHESEYKAIDQICGNLTEREIEIGRFEEI